VSCTPQFFLRVWEGLVLIGLFFSFFFYYSYVHTRLGSFLSPAPTPPRTTHSAPSISPPLNTQQVFKCWVEFTSSGAIYWFFFFVFCFVLFYWRFWLLAQSPYTLFICSSFLVHHDSVLVGCMFLGINPFLLSHSVWWHIINHSCWW
jgi:hypothetical protein